MGEQSWRAGWPSSAETFWQFLEVPWTLLMRLMLCRFQKRTKKTSRPFNTKEVVFSSNYWTDVVSLVKNRRAMAEYLTMTPSFKEEIKKVDEQYAAEAKSRKQLLKEMGSVVEAADGAGEDLEVWVDLNFTWHQTTLILFKHFHFA